MNIKRYNALVRSKFSTWRKKCFPRTSGPVRLVQDHERCLWRKGNLKVLRKAGFAVLSKYPKYSPDLNAIEGWWRLLRQKLEKNAPVEHETRAGFIKRLKRTVDLMNKTCRATGLKLCRNQTTRANDVLKLGGA